MLQAPMSLRSCWIVVNMNFYRKPLSNIGQFFHKSSQDGVAGFGFSDAKRGVGRVVGEKYPVQGVLGDAFDGFGANGIRAEFRKVGDDDLTVPSWGPVVFENQPITHVEGGSPCEPTVIASFSVSALSALCRVSPMSPLSLF